MEKQPALLTTISDWDSKWPEIFDQYQQDLRHAHYINALRNPNETHLLEIGAGSFRDMAALCNWGVKCEGMDFSKESVLRAKSHFPDLANNIHQMDAFNFDFRDQFFDMTYHNGVWVLFNDEEIDLLAKEQARISKYRMIATVHNAHNDNFKAYFDKKAETDPLFKIRFFFEEEIRSLMSKVCSKVHVVPVGKGKKYYEDEIINSGNSEPTLLRKFFQEADMKYLNQSERLMCIGEL
jgi:hypothetical protein